jgi:MazG family protein
MNAESLSFDRLVGIVRELRERCPWDREQTLASAGKYLIEEAYEAADAINRGDSAKIADELGDLLVQVLFATVMAEQEARFQCLAMLQAAADKLVRRHPHIYATTKAETANEVVTNWHRIKREERRAEGLHSALDGIARSLPALMLAQKLGSRAQQAGLDWADIHEVLAKVREEMDEVEGALSNDDREAAASELGDMLLALANAPRFIGYDAEDTLHRSCDKFIRRFAVVERIASERRLELTRMTAAELEALWQEAKSREWAEADDHRE